MSSALSLLSQDAKQRGVVSTANAMQFPSTIPNTTTALLVNSSTGFARLLLRELINPNCLVTIMGM